MPDAKKVHIGDQKVHGDQKHPEETEEALKTRRTTFADKEKTLHELNEEEALKKRGSTIDGRKKSVDPDTDPDHVHLQSVLTYHEEIPAGSERHLATNLDAAFAPCRLFMLILFRFPLLLSVREDFSREFAYSWKSFRGWMFFITGAILIINVTLIIFNLGSVLLDYPPQPEEYSINWHNKKTNSTMSHNGKVKLTQEQLRIQELYLIQRNFVPIVILLLSLCHVCAGDITLFFRRDFIAKYFTFWDEAIEIMKMDAGMVPENVGVFMTKITLFYTGFLLIFLSVAIGNFMPMATGAPAQLAILWCRCFYPPIHAWEHFMYVRWVGYGLYGYLICTSKAYVLLFIYKCKILKNAFAIWNERLETVLHKGAHRTRKEQCETRTGFDHLFRDYVVLLDLLHGADTMFTNVVESYYGTQVFSLCFEVYYVQRSIAAHDQFRRGRKLDAVLMGIYLFHSLIMLFVSSTAAAEVGETAMEGLEIIRRKGFIGRKTNQEMYFTLSLYMSYAGHFQTALSGGRFVIFDRGFIVALVGSIFSYYIILTQFTPPLALLDTAKLSRIEEDGKTLIEHIEYTRGANEFDKN